MPENLKPEELLHLLVEGVKDYAIFLIDPAGLIIHWNRGAERILGYTDAEVIGKHFSCIFTSEDALRGEPEQEMRTAVQAERSEDVRWHVRKDGTRFWGDGVLMPLHDAAGNLRCFAKILRDRTDQKEHEDLLRHRAEALADADTQKNLFLATLAHELRSPLAGVVNAMNVLRVMSKDIPTLDHPLKIIERQAGQIRRLVDDLNDVARISTGKVQLQKERVELAPLIQSAVEATRSFVDERGHHLAVSLPQAPVYLEADPIRLQQVFANLLTNAARYTNNGGDITVSGTMQGNEIVVRVRDTGIGISAEMLPRIFDLFTQVDPAAGYTHGGLGIGLSLVKNLVELHGGSVQARSEGIGKGSEFSVRLPAQ